MSLGTPSNPWLRGIGRDRHAARLALAWLAIVAITAYGGQRMPQAKDAGADVCFEKPLDHPLLLDMVARLARSGSHG